MSDFETMPIGSRKMLEDCATQFQYYADLHDAKGTYESSVKAKVNREWVARIRKLLDGTVKSL